MSTFQFHGDNHQAKAKMFWGEIAPCDHLVQLYEDDVVFLDSLEGFVAGGLEAGDGVIVIATTPHLDTLEDRLRRRGLNLNKYRSEDCYIAVDAEETLSKFVIEGVPDEDLFMRVISKLLTRARGTKSGGKERRVRAFGEMVAIMWGQGLTDATVQLEHLWQELCRKEAFSLFCAYPRSGFAQEAEESIKEICAAHSNLV
jgi:hypothetical protein